MENMARTRVIVVTEETFGYCASGLHSACIAVVGNTAANGSRVWKCDCVCHTSETPTPDTYGKEVS